MTDTEQKFREWAKKEYPGAFIKKMPDFKQLATGALIGMPDYLVICEGVHHWWEVKKVQGKTLNLKHFTPGQKQVFPKMIKAGAQVNIYTFFNGGKAINTFQELMIYKKIKLGEGK
jgi:hypothetical protein